MQDPTSTASQMSSALKKYSVPYGQMERARIFTNLIKVYSELKDYEKAKKVVARAISEFSGTPQEVQVMFAQS